jgi:hypothetical protein
MSDVIANPSFPVILTLTLSEAKGKNLNQGKLRVAISALLPVILREPFHGRATEESR